MFSTSQQKCEKEPSNGSMVRDSLNKQPIWESKLKDKKFNYLIVNSLNKQPIWERKLKDRKFNYLIVNSV